MESHDRTRQGLGYVGLSLAVLGLASVIQLIVFLASGSIALLADLIHNVGDAATALPVGLAFVLHSERAERWSGGAVVLAILVSAAVAAYTAIQRLINPQPVTHLLPLAMAGAIGFAGNWIAGIIRTRGGKRLGSAALIADGAHAGADAYASLAAVASATLVALGWQVADPVLGLALTAFILHVAWDAWGTVRRGTHQS
ncbi:MAG: cation diffusion facilitator family transporter [Actinomycetota bacterium]|nr:cation diffusion facilitator family transporter [Actinomycetota bacterium]